MKKYNEGYVTKRLYNNKIMDADDFDLEESEIEDGSERSSNNIFDAIGNNSLNTSADSKKKEEESNSI